MDPVGKTTVRILANTADLSPNTGITVQTLQVTEELARRGHQVDLVYLQDGDYRGRLFLLLSVHPGECRRSTSGCGTRSATHPDWCRGSDAGLRTRPDVIYLNRFRPLPWALATGTLARAPVVCHLHGLIGLEKPPVNRALSRLTARFICVSQFVRDRFVELGGDPARTVVVHNGIDVADYPSGDIGRRAAARAELGLSPDPFIVMFFGRVVQERASTSSSRR